MNRFLKSTAIIVALIAASTTIAVEAHVGSGKSRDGKVGNKSCHRALSPYAQMTYEGTKQPCMHTRYERRSKKNRDCCHLHYGNSARTEWQTSEACQASCKKRGNRLPVTP